MYTVTIVMSTYNGEKYLKEQIDSVLSQEGVDVSLFIRDDGSTDNTIKILNSYLNHPNFSYVSGSNVGPCQSFLNALEMAPKSEFYAFADQDDVWDKDKMIIAISAIEGYSVPALYHSLAGLVDEKLHPLKNKEYKPLQTFGGSLLTSSTGCTMVFNEPLYQLLKSRMPNTSNIYMHDVWIYNVAYAIGAKVIYDYTSHMKYRQHSSNVTGGHLNFRTKLYKLLHVTANTRQKMSLEILDKYRDLMSEENIELSTKLANYSRSFKDKFRLLTETRIRTNYFKTNLQIKLLILINKL